MNPGFAQTFVAGIAIAHKQTQGNMNQVQAILSPPSTRARWCRWTPRIRIESKYFAKVVADPQANAMIRSLFVSKQAAEKGARRPKPVSTSAPVKKLGMLGAGLMGSGIAMVSAQAGIEVVLLDSTQEAADKGKQYTADQAGQAQAPTRRSMAEDARPHPPDNQLSTT